MPETQNERVVEKTIFAIAIGMSLASSLLLEAFLGGGLVAIALGTIFISALGIGISKLLAPRPRKKN